MKINAEKFVAKAVAFVRNYFKNEGLAPKAVIGLSGGIDSAVTYAILVRALGKENVTAIMLPNSQAGSEACDWACQVTAEFGVLPKKIDIGPMVRLTAAMLAAENDPVRLGNIAARTRMIVLMDQAKKEGAILVGTENKTEHYLGYFTIGGDEVSNLEIIRDLYKTQVREVARYLGIPQGVIDKPPTADLWEGQTDEEELGFTYEEADLILEAIFDLGLDKQEMFDKGFDCVKVAKVKDRIRKVDFKIREKPYPKVD